MKTNNEHLKPTSILNKQCHKYVKIKTTFSLVFILCNLLGNKCPSYNVKHTWCIYVNKHSSGHLNTIRDGVFKTVNENCFQSSGESLVQLSLPEGKNNNICYLTDV